MYGVYSQQSGGGPSAPEVIIIGGRNSRIFRSTDDGLTFSEQIVYHPSQPSTAVPVWGRVFYCNGKFFISGNYGCMVSHDYGLTWVNVITNQQMFSVVWNGTYYFAGINYQIRRSVDLVTWTNLSANAGSNYQTSNDLCVVGEDVYWSTNRKTTTPVSFLSIQKCIAPYNQANISTIYAGNSTSIPNGTRGILYKTANGLILTTTSGGTQQRIYSTINYTSLTAGNTAYSVSAGGSFDIIVGNTAYRFAPSSVTPKGYGSPVINTLSTTTAPNNGGVIGIDSNGTIFAATATPQTTNIWIRGVAFNTTAWTSTDMGFNTDVVFYTGKSFLVFGDIPANTQLRRSETGIGGWSTAITPFGGNFGGGGGTSQITSSYKI